MASLYPRRPSVETPDRDAAVIELAADASDAVLDALASDTGRAILDRLAAEPAPASTLADDLDTSLQNVQYHLRKLREAGLIAEAGTWYSSRGKEMRVYAPAVDRLTFRLHGPDPEDPPARAD